MEVKDENLSEEELDKQVEKLARNSDYLCWLVAYINERLHRSLAILDVAAEFIFSAKYSNPCDYAQGRAIAGIIKELLEEEAKID